MQPHHIDNAQPTTLLSTVKEISNVRILHEDGNQVDLPLHIYIQTIYSTSVLLSDYFIK